MLYKVSKNKAFTLIETLVGVAVFLIISTAAYQAYASLFTLISLNQYKIIALNLANEKFEAARGLPYADLEETAGSGEIVRSGISFNATTTVSAGEKTKLMELEIGCPSCKSFIPLKLTTQFYE